MTHTSNVSTDEKIRTVFPYMKLINIAILFMILISLLVIV